MSSKPLTDISPYEGGFGRRPWGRGFSYFVWPNGDVINGATRARLETLAAPPNWSKVWYAEAPTARILCCGEDEAGRRQYIYHPEARLQADFEKFRRLPEFARALPRLRRWIRSRLSDDAETGARSVALVLRLIDRAAMRVGDPGNSGYGATTLEGQHIAIRDGRVVLSWQAKGGRIREADWHDPLIAEALENEALDPDAPLFDASSLEPVSARRVNALIEEKTGAAFSAKTFRTWIATARAAGWLSTADQPTITGACEAAADRLGNTAAICRSSYVHPLVIEAARDERPVPDAPDGPRGLKREERLCLAWLEAEGAAGLSRWLEAERDV